MFLADLIVLRHLKTVLAKMSENSYLREFFAQVSKSVFLAALTVLRLIKLYEQKCHKTHISTSLCKRITSRVLSLFDSFTANKLCMRENVTKLISSPVLCTTVTKRVLK